MGSHRNARSFPRAVGSSVMRTLLSEPTPWSRPAPRHRHSSPVNSPTHDSISVSWCTWTEGRRCNECVSLTLAASSFLFLPPPFFPTQALPKRNTQFLQTHEMNTHIHSPDTHAMNTQIHSLKTHDTNIYIRFLEILETNTHIHSHSGAQHFHNLHVNASCGSESSHFWMGHIESECVMLPLYVSCSLWMHHVILNMSPLNASCYCASRNSAQLTHTYLSRKNCESPISSHSLTRSLQRVTTYPTLGVPSLPYLLLSTCRLQWVPTPLHLEFYPCILYPYTHKHPWCFLLIDSNGYSPPTFGVLTVYRVTLHS